MSQITILIVDEHIACRDIIQNTLSGAKDLSIMGAAPNGKLGLDKIRQKNPDLVLLSSGLPDVSAYDFTRQALAIAPSTGIIILASPEDDPQSVIKALEAGAFDFIKKPLAQCSTKDQGTIQRTLLAKIRCFIIEYFSHKAKKLDSTKQAEATQPYQHTVPAIQALTSDADPLHIHSFDMVLIGVSTGGPKALVELLPAFPANFPIPIVIVLHMPKAFTKSMAEELDRKSPLSVKETQDGEPIKGGVAYLAQGGIHWSLNHTSNNQFILKSIDSPPVNGCKPSVDVMFKSVATMPDKNVVALILTGMGNDGTNGCAELKKGHAHIIAQDKSSSVVWGMPGSAVNGGYVDEILPLQEIAKRVIQITGLV